MKLTDEQHALLSERLTELMMRDISVKDLERMVYDMYLDEYLLMSDEDLLVEAELFEIEVPSDEA
jgi:hypothetical protein